MTKSAPPGGVRRALDGDQLVLFYQPIHDLQSRRIVAAEALLRARRENGELRSGAPIAAGAEKGPDLFRLDSWLVHQAYDDAARWQSGPAPDVRLNVNLSPREFQEGNVVARLTKLLAGCGVQAEKVNLEVTETSYIKDPQETRDVLHALKENGMQVWLDDFGTGHSSIEHLQLFPVDGLKLPAEFVRGVAGEQRSRAIVRALVTLAHELEMKVIAEGVEHDDQLKMLADCGCDYIQGFLFSKPMPVEEFERELASGVTRP